MTTSTASVCPRCGAELPPGFAFCGRCGQPLSPAADVAVAPTAAAGERRHVTVLFVDVQGFTARSEGMDPEEVRDWMGGWLARFGRVVEEEGGHVDKYTGDGLMALFGAPTTHEDDPQRACRAALAILRLCDGDGPGVRIGIHSGLVVAGHVGSAAAAYTAMGETVNVASRLEGAARVGSALVSAEIARQVRRGFAVGPPLRLEVKGKSAPVEAHELLGEASAEPGEMLRAPFVGRERELASVLERLAAAGAEGAWIHVEGELGIGKTRFAEEVLGRASERRGLFVTASERSQRRALGLLRLIVLAALRRLAPEAGRPQTRDDVLRALASMSPGLDQHVDALWELAAPNAALARPASTDPRTRQRMIEHAVGSVVAALHQQSGGAVLVIDGWEWADAGSVELLASVRGRPAGLPALAIVLSRPEGVAPPEGPTVVLPRLSEAEARRLLEGSMPGVALPPSLLNDLLERSAGVPLHLIEMVRGLVESRVVRRLDDGSWDVDDDARSAELPATIRAAMVSRLDRLPPAQRALLGRCAVQGVEFDAAVVEATGAPEESASATLDELAARGFVAELHPAARRWVFRHPLLAETAYELLLLQHRRRLHAVTARVLAARAGGEDRVAPDVLAHHWERAEAWSDAARAQLRAAEVAAGLYLNAVALRWFERCLASVDRLESASSEDRRVALRALAGAAEVALLIGDYDGALERAAALRERSDEPVDRARAHVLAARADLGRGRTGDAEAWLQDALDEGERTSAQGRTVCIVALGQLARLRRQQGRTAEALLAVREARELLGPDDTVFAGQLDSIEGRIAHSAGRFDDARVLFERAYAAARRSRHLGERAAAANDLGNVARDRGDYAAARRQFSRALALWRRMGDTEGVAGASVNLANLALSEGDLTTARRWHGQARDAALEIGNVAGVALAWANLAIVALEEEDAAGAVASCEEALTALAESDNQLLRGQILVVLGEAFVVAGENGRAREIFEDLLRTYGEGVHPLVRAGAWRGLGRLALRSGDTAAALEHLERALVRFEKLKREQEAARTMVDHAEALWRAGKRERALADLEVATARFREIRAAADVAHAEERARVWRAELSAAVP